MSSFPALTPVENIDLDSVYYLLGASDSYQREKRKFDLTEDPKLWKVIMVKDLPYVRLIPALYDRAGIDLSFDGLMPEFVFNFEKDQRNPNKVGYMVTFERYINAGQKNSFQSASRRKGQDFKDITLTEYLILDVSYFLRTGTHLGEEFWTLCSGSRTIHNKVPGVQYFPEDNKIIVDTFSPGDSRRKLCTREVVSVFLNA